MHSTLQEFLTKLLAELRLIAFLLTHLLQKFTITMLLNFLLSELLEMVLER
jgi:hypothetical protein